MTDALRFEVRGPVRAWRGDVEIELGPPQQRAAPAVLLLQEGTPLSPAQPVSARWGGAERRAAVGMVRSYVSRLRHVGVEIESVGGGYALCPTPRTFWSPRRPRPSASRLATRRCCWSP
ncbi:hypothetical protein [Amycolatopsis sp. NPDC051128]|uniref:AfsR/SARP family transcriptional regulator n=1 Tax=Amycolatopsis sp. NPDC051128 TaxID=3155412 RepID=UPI0034419BAE